jgi:excisionase family DNA binding protein
VLARQRIVSRATIYKLIDIGELPAHKIGTRTTVVLHEDWLAWLRARPDARPISATEQRRVDLAATARAKSRRQA